MDLSAVRTRRKKSLFRPWNSYLAKKGVADAAAPARACEAARRRAPANAPLVRLSAGLLDTYEGINEAYYQNRANSDIAPFHRPERRRDRERDSAHDREIRTGRPADLVSEPGTASSLAASQAPTSPGSLGSVGPAPASAASAISATSVASAASASASAVAAAVPIAPSGTAVMNDVALGASLSNTGLGHHSHTTTTATTRKKKKKKSSSSASKKVISTPADTSPMSVQYCDENFDYIVRTGEMFNNRYMLEKVIGRGSFGQVVRAIDTRDNTHVAIKIIKNNTLFVEQALSEVRMTSYLNRIDPEDAHSIMRLRDKFIFRGHQCLVLELLSFSLYDLLRSTEFYGVSLNLVRKFCKQILNCLAFLARPDVNIAHCDLKPENVLLRHPQRSAIKVVDFGASCRITESMFTYVQSRFYRAPEVILGLPYGTQVDVWSLGCMLIELHTGYPVFAGKDEAHQMAIIVERLGIPPDEMLRAGKKTKMFFERDNVTREWRMKADVCGGGEIIVPGSKPIDGFVDLHTGASNGRRKRVSGGHSEEDYSIFLGLVYKMLQYEPESRISAEGALREDFVVGGCGGRSGRESPPGMPAMGKVGEDVIGEVDPGRKAPVQHRGKRVGISKVVAIHTDASIGDLGEIGGVGGISSDGEDVGGKLRLSKSEPEFKQLFPRRKEQEEKTFVFKTSDWAEEVGIEPPPWRAGGGSGNGGGEEGVVCGRGRGGRRGVRRRQLGAAGGGCGMGSGVCDGRRRRDVVRRMGRAEEKLSFGLSGTIGREGEGRRRVVVARAGVVAAALPRGHGNALLLLM